MFAALRHLGPRWVGLVLAVGAVDGVGILVGGLAALVAAVGTLLSGLALYQRGHSDAQKAVNSDLERQLREALQRENELLRETR